MKSVLVFDLDDTLIPSSKAYVLARKRCAINEPDYETARLQVKQRLPKGSTQAHNRLLYFKKMLENQGVFSAGKLLSLHQQYVDAVKSEISEFWSSGKRAQLLSDLSAKYQLAVLTNENTFSQIQKLSVMDPYGDLFSLVLTSEEMGAEKPNEGLFFEVESCFAELQPSQFTMIGDDLQKDIVPAAARGWRTVLTKEFHDSETDLTQLSTLDQTEVVESLNDLSYKL